MWSQVAHQLQNDNSKVSTVILIHVDREIFVVKIISLVAYNDKN